MIRGSITTISYDSKARDEINSQLNHLVGRELKINSLCCDELDPQEKISDDLILITAPVVRDIVIPRIKPGCKYLVATRTVNTSNLKKLFDIPPGSKVIVFNNLLENTIEVVNELKAIGINHLDLHAYDFKTPQELTDYKYAVTIGEPHLVPKHIPVSVDLGHRLISIVTIGKILDHFNVSKTLDYLVSSRYMKDLVRLSMELTAHVNQNEVLLRQMETIVSDLEDGVIVTDAEQKILLHNKSATNLLGLSQDIRGKGVVSVLPWLNTTELPAFYNVNGRELHVSEGHPDPDGNKTTMITLKDLTKIRGIDEDYRKQQKQTHYAAKYKFSNIVYTSPAMKNLVNKAQKLAKSDSSILLIGESGTGKELLAQSIHNSSPRSSYPFVAINCAALNENLLESELFGYREGAFTGARKGGKKGLFELAHLGSIFLDEIGDAPYSIQTKLLRVLQEREIMRVGGEKVIPIDVRVIAATNKDLKHLVEEGSFRRDLYYRINILPLYVPPLRERQGDVEVMLKYYLHKYALRENIPLPHLPPEILDILLSYPWPGNIRELENLAEYITIIAPVSDNLHQDILDNLVLEQRAVKTSPTQHNDPLPLFTDSNIRSQAIAILKALRAAKQGSIMMGRGKLQHELNAVGIELTNQQIKTRLETLRDMKLLQSIVGKGTVILPKGEEFLDQK